MLRALRSSSRRLGVLGLLIGLACVGALPETALADGSITPPAAVRFTLNLQLTGFGSGRNSSLSGVANHNGDTQVTVIFGDHQYGFIMAGGVAYESEDGGPYQIVTPSPGPTGAGVSDAPTCAGSPAGLNPLVQQALTGQGLWTMLGIQDLGPATIGGLQAEHYQGSVDLSRALTDPLFMQALNGLLNACGGGDAQLSAALPLLLSASQMSADVYVDPSTSVPLQFDLNLSVPILSAGLDLSGQMTPLSSPVAITAPS